MKIRTTKTTHYPRTTSKTFEILSDENCDYAVNAKKSGDGLLPGVSLATQTTFPSLPQGVNRAYYSQGNGALYLLTSSAAYRISKGASSYTSIATSLTGNPFFTDMYFNGYAVTVFCNGYSRVIYTGLAQDTATDTKRFYCAAVHCGRFFARDYLDGFKLWWSASHALDWEEGIYGCGYTYLPVEGGAILRLYSYGDRLIAVRERGITVIRAYGDPQNYKVDASANYMTADGIIEDTCAESGGKIIFCTESGIFAFDGSGIDRLASFAAEGLSAPQFAAASGDMYYLVCTISTLGSGRMYCFDLSENYGWPTTLTPRALFEGPDGAYAVSGNVAFKIVQSGQSLQWLSLPVALGGRAAYLKKLRACCDGDVSVSVSSLGVSRTFSGSGEHVVNMAGDEFKFTVTAYGKLRSVQAQAEV